MYDERAVYGVDQMSLYKKWQLDQTEGPYRMRKRMEHNPTFYKQYPNAEKIQPERMQDPKIPTSEDTVHYLRTKQFGRDSFEAVASPLVCARIPPSPRLRTRTTTMNIRSSRDSNDIPSSPSPRTGRRPRSNTEGSNKPPDLATILQPQKPPAPDSGVRTLSFSGEGVPAQRQRLRTTMQRDSATTATFVSLSAELDIEDDWVEIEETSGALSPATLLRAETMKQQEGEVNTNNEGGHFGQTSASTPIDTVPTSTTTHPSAPSSDYLRSNWKEIEPLAMDDDFILTEAATNVVGEAQRISKCLQPGEESITLHNCGSVTGMEVCLGLLVVCKKRLYFVKHYCLSPHGEIKLAAAYPQLFTTYNPSSAVVPTADALVPDPIKIEYDDVLEILRRRYLLRHAAIEIFQSNGTSVLLTFDIKDRERVYKQLCSLARCEGDTGEQLSSARGAEEEERWPFDSFWRKASATVRWQQGEMSNFQYLMHLNTLAGRSYKDLSQYPCFPWVLSDYTSAELNLNNPQVFRDLSRPMGAISPLRASKFRERYENWEPEEQEGVPKWHYGTHYSTAGIVALFMIRLEPFTQYFVKLQSGKFDVPDRLFHSIEEAWASASGQGDNYSLTDVRELTPEFYYLPEFLLNSNKFIFGEKHTGERIGDVVLPPWAKNDARQFIALQRAALESDYVSAHLHEWIDLVFGYKQQGEAAADALNVFYHLTYEGSVDIDNIRDKTVREAALSQINNYGQTPKQLFTKPHPRRKIPVIPFGPVPIDHSAWVPFCLAESGAPVGQLHIATNKKVMMLVDLQQAFLPPKFSKYIAWGYPDGSLRLHEVSDNRTLAVVETVSSWGRVKHAALSEDGGYLISGGSDAAITVHRIRQETSAFVIQRLKRLHGHNGAITCVAVSQAYSIIVSGSKDQSCIIWNLNTLSYVRTIGPFPYIVTTVTVNSITGDVIVCAGNTPRLFDINGKPIAPASAHTPGALPAPAAQYLPAQCSPSTRDHITAFTIAQPAACDWLTTQTVYISGHADGAIQLWMLTPEMNDWQLLRRLSMHSAPISSLCLAPGERSLYSGDVRGRQILWTTESEHTATSAQPTATTTTTTNPTQPPATSPTSPSFAALSSTSTPALPLTHHASGHASLTHSSPATLHDPTASLSDPSSPPSSTSGGGGSGGVGGGGGSGGVGGGGGGGGGGGSGVSSPVMPDMRRAGSLRIFNTGLVVRRPSLSTGEMRGRFSKFMQGATATTTAPTPTATTTTTTTTTTTINVATATGSQQTPDTQQE
eukprot:TRINITY_DN4695_c0_g1_i1.p1 TRINITY_DN4695_c0_g1~~TRINITY_DN4695_c0_g1_i1.p1  ORF type:complete len:1272 (-),score=238.23 TRINITY_DN4695_c0_g1_i1:14-3829(-)